MSNERTEESYIGLSDFFVFPVKSLKMLYNYRCAFIPVNSFVTALIYVYINLLLKF